MEDAEKQKQSDFYRAQEQLRRNLEMASHLSGSDRTAAERRAWDMYHERDF